MDTTTSAPDWAVELERQERSYGWLGRHTDRSASAVARYASGSLTPPASWLVQARSVLGIIPPEEENELRAAWGDR